MSKRFRKWKKEIKMETGKKVTNRELRCKIRHAEMVNKVAKKYINFYEWE